jgi:hypothetical protein
MKADKKFYKCPGVVVSIAVLLLAALAVPVAVAMTSGTKTQPKPVSKQNEEELSRLTAKLVKLASVKPAAITVEKLADICEAMESAIVDVSMEYEWYIEPPQTVEDIAGTGMLIPKDGLYRHKFSAARSLAARDTNDPNFLLFDRLLVEDSETIMNAEGDCSDNVTKKSYNGKFGKYVSISGGFDGALRTSPDGTITESRSFIPSLILSPLGFSVFRFSLSRGMDYEPLFEGLRKKEFVRIDNTIEKVNGFYTIRAELLTFADKLPYLRIYFSVDHGYTPVRYEHGAPQSKNILTFEVQSLEQVAEGLWFPSSGLVSVSGKKRSNGFRAISEIVVNQGLTDEDFDIEFPPGTRVRDEIRDTEYIVKPTKEQKEKFEKEKQWAKEHAEEMAAKKREGGRFYSAARLHRLGTAIDMYMMMQDDKKYPQTLDDLKPYFSDKDKEFFSWLLKNVEYLGAGLEPEKVDVSGTPIAYDKTLLKKSEGTNVLFVNGLVKFCRLEELGKLGINDSEEAQVE